MATLRDWEGWDHNAWGDDAWEVVELAETPSIQEVWFEGPRIPARRRPFVLSAPGELELEIDEEDLVLQLLGVL